MNDIAIDTIMRFRNERLISPNEDMPRESYFKASYSMKMELFARETDDEEAKLKFRVASDVAEEIMLLFV